MPLVYYGLVYKIEVQDNLVSGSQSLILPGSLVQKNVILGALSVAPMNSTFREGGVYIGSQSQVVIRNSVKNSYDEGKEETDMVSKIRVGNLAAALHKNESHKVTLTRTWSRLLSLSLQLRKMWSSMIIFRVTLLVKLMISLEVSHLSLIKILLQCEE